MPWGGLLAAVAGAEADAGRLSALRDICKSSADLQHAGFAVTARPLSVAEVRALGTTWAGRLGWSGKDRRFVEIRGQCLRTGFGSGARGIC